MKNSPAIKKLAGYLALLSLTFILIVGLLMILNHLQIKTHNPIESGAIEQLIIQLEKEDNQQLREEIRALDLLARKAYFSSLWQLKTGAWLLIGFGLLFVVSLKVYNDQTEIPGVQPGKVLHFWALKSKERHWIALGAGIVLVVALVVSFSTRAYYTDFDSYAAAGKKALSAAGGETSTALLPDNFPDIEEILAEHPSFRGAFGLGHSRHSELPVEWDAGSGKNILWKTAVPLPGLNSPIVWGERVFLAGADENSRKVFCYNSENGELLWEREVNNIPGSPAEAPEVTDDTGYSASGMTTDGQGVYAIFANGDLVCFTVEGEQVWGLNLGQPDNHYGHSSSLQLYRDKLIVQLDDNQARRLLAISARSGKSLWETRREGDISWSSPIIVPKGESAEIIVNNSPYVAAYKVDNGEELWKVNCLSGEIGPSPAYGNGMVFAVNEYAKLVAIKEGEILWENYNFLSDVSSPVAYGDYLFCTTSYGDLACLSQQDGSLLWHHEFDNGFYGSPVVAEDKLYCTDRAGGTIVVEVGPEFKLLSHSPLGERSDATPAFAQGKIFIRGYEHLFCISKQ
jgi:outer membrane protein assembly factor BamB